MTAQNNFREFFKTKLPERFWGDDYPILKRLLGLILVPYDIYLQVLEYVPRIKDLKNKSVPDDALKIIGSERGLEKFSSETSNSYADKLYQAWEIWKYAGSRYGINLVFKLSNITLDETTYEYGIQERLEDQYDSYWGEPYLFWDKFEYGSYSVEDGYDGYAYTWATYAIHVSDPTTSISTNQATIEQIKDMAKKFASAHTRLCYLHFTDGAGNIHTSIDLRNET
jgi:hypothetical protein